MKVEMGRPHVVLCHAATAALFDVLPAALAAVQPQGDASSRSPAALVVATPDQAAFLDDMDAFSAGLARAGMLLRDPIGLVAPANQLLDGLLRHAERLILAEGRDWVFCALAEGERLAVFVVRPAGCSGLPAASPARHAPSGGGIERLLSSWQGIDTTWAWQRVSSEALDERRVQSFVQCGDALVMPQARSAAITHVGVHTGVACGLDDVGDEILDADAKSLLAALGVESFHRASEPLSSLCIQAIAQVLREVDDPGRIGRVILSSHTFIDATDQLRTLADDLRRLGLDVPIELVYMTRCASAVSALRVALGDILTGFETDVLVVLVDSVFDERKGRTLNKGMSLFSDGACAFVVSTDAPGLKVRGLCEVTDHTMYGLKPADDFVNYLKAFGAGLRKPVDSLRKALPDISIARVVTGNYNMSIMRNYGAIAGFPPRLLYTDQLARHAHLFSSDLVLNAAAMAVGDALGPGESVLLIGAGSYHWGGMVLTLEGKPRFHAEGWVDAALAVT